MLYLLQLENYMINCGKIISVVLSCDIYVFFCFNIIFDEMFYYDELYFIYFQQYVLFRISCFFDIGFLEESSKLEGLYWF